MADDISKRTVGVLLLIAVVLSVIGTWNVLLGVPMGVSSTAPPVVSGPDMGSAQVGYTLLPDGPEVKSNAVGQVSFGIQ